MQVKTLTTIRWFRPAVGAGLSVLLGWLLLTPLGDPWVNASFDYLPRFGSRPVTNRVVLIQMDNEAYAEFGQTRGQPWDRSQHARLLDHLSADGCRLAVFDVFFGTAGDAAKDAALAEAMKRHSGVVLMAGQADRQDKQNLASARPVLPAEPFLSASGNRWGVAWLDPDVDATVRRHWPFPAPGPYDSLAWAAAKQAGAALPESPVEQWIRYYDRDAALRRLSYGQAFTQPTNFFRDAVVFIGNKPATTLPNGEVDKFRVPATRWTGEAVGGMEIQAMLYLNLINGDWLRRLAGWQEGLLLTFTGALCGGVLPLLRRRVAGTVAVVSALGVALIFVTLSHEGDVWFPWLIISGGQVPCALAWAMLTPMARTEWSERFPGYTVLGEPFGEGSYGKVWLVRNALGQLQALKEIQRAKFPDADPYDREFNGIKNYKPVSNQHLGLLWIDHVNRNERDGYFYYVMELGDALNPGWEAKGERYQPCVLTALCKRADRGRLPAVECVRIGVALAEALEFLHQQGLVHRDIKPSNVVFVNGRPKLADVGLVRKTGGELTYVGTEFYMPPEGPGTPLGDVYALGKMLYVISTGQHPRSFSELSTTLVVKPEFMRLNQIICRACQPEVAMRYASIKEMLAELKEAEREIGGNKL
ncbi:MAG: serine/threonine-protein kinase [Verrucomicrobiota bacterium]